MICHPSLPPSFCNPVGPTIRAVLAAATAVAGTNINLLCKATGNPVPIQTWTQNGIPLSDSRFQIQSGGSELSVRDVNEGDEGRYQCRASNTAGSAIATVDLSVISKWSCDNQVIK